ncbi:hypothetical protein [Nocardioides agariphilus]|nr:hypothetical protein [Nocardioides agariphilus]
MVEIFAGRMPTSYVNAEAADRASEADRLHHEPSEPARRRKSQIQ